MPMPMMLLDSTSKELAVGYEGHLSLEGEDSGFHSDGFTQGSPTGKNCADKHEYV